MSFYKPEKLPKLMVAPNGARKVKKDHPAVPLTISETVEVLWEPKCRHKVLPPDAGIRVWRVRRVTETR